MLPTSRERNKIGTNFLFSGASGAAFLLEPYSFCFKTVVPNFCHFRLRRMAAVVQMRNALMRCGLNQATSTYMMDEQGFDSTEELLMSSKEAFDTMVKNAIKSAPPGVVFSSASIRRLNAFKYWAEERDRCGLEVGPLLFTNEVLQEYLLLMRADEIEVEAKKGQVPTKPDILKSDKEWFRF